jgi:hypothetical protein
MAPATLPVSAPIVHSAAGNLGLVIANRARRACPRSPGSGGSPRLLIQDWTKPGDRAPCCRKHFDLRRVFTTREVADRSPRTHVLGISAELLEAVGSIGARENVHAAIAFVRLMTDENQPRLVEPRRHHPQCYSADSGGPSAPVRLDGSALRARTSRAGVRRSCGPLAKVTGATTRGGARLS